jgi:hypothetical protein
MLHMCILQVPTIKSIKIEPSQVAQGDTFQVVVTLQAPLTSGFVSVVSSPAGISCPESPKSIVGLPVVRVTCVVPVSTTAQSAAAQMQRTKPAIQPATTQQASAAAKTEVADIMSMTTASEDLQEAEQGTQPQAQVAAIPTPSTTTFTLTATVTADRTASATTTVQVGAGCCFLHRCYAQLFTFSGSVLRWPTPASSGRLHSAPQFIGAT